MVTFVWFLLIIIGILAFIFTGNINVLNKSLLSSINSSFSLIYGILPGIVLWCGIMKIAENSGLLTKLSLLLKPILYKLFPTIPKDSKALDFISSNIVANMLGLGSVATPYGLKAMKELQKYNLKKDEATHAMQTFLVINTAGVTLIPTMVISLRINYSSINPFIIIIPSIIITSLSCLFAIFLNYIWGIK